ncbi:poly-specific ribonuclease parn [Pelomyxa schiedti]|nr:poly-specific ribonuclease parn [Pelomyxa schiedti]
MDVVRENFLESLPIIEEAIQQSDFVAIDTELTGLSSEQDQESMLDTVQDRYSKIRSSSISDNFLIIQVGLCPFKWNSDKNTFVATPFNFYIFPAPMNRDACDRRFMCQSSSLAFLASTGFDFNKLFNHGIGYLTPSQENDLKRKMELRAVQSEPVPVGENKPFVDSTIATVTEWLKNSPDQKTLSLPPCNSFLRLLLFQALESNFPHGIYVESVKAERAADTYISIHRASDEEKVALQKKKQEEDQRAFDMAVGFTKVVSLLRQSNKPIVGHNMLRDVCLLVSQFWEPKLPESVATFKALVNGLFQQVFDTKFIASTLATKIPGLNYTALPDLFNRIKQAPFAVTSEFPSTTPKYSSANSSWHEAGFDAYCTGMVFSAFVHHLREPTTIPDLKPVSHMKNKLFLMKCDPPYLHLEGPEETTARDHVFVIENFPPEWRYSHIRNLFKPFGDINVNWCNSTTAVVVMHEKDRNKAHLALDFFRQNNNSAPNTNCTVLQIETWRASRAAPLGQQQPQQASVVVVETLTTTQQPPTTPKPVPAPTQTGGSTTTSTTSTPSTPDPVLPLKRKYDEP